jgi:NAD-dependent DNA ligase
MMINTIQLARMMISGDMEPDENIIVGVLSDASSLYHNGEQSFFSDAEYDVLERFLKTINPNNPFLAQTGSDVRGGKVKLPHVMAGLDQVHEGDTEKWIIANGWQNQEFVVSDKEDGTSGLLIYGKGPRAAPFTAAYSRGNGTEGADISRHVRRMGNVPRTMPYPCVVRVEFILQETIFIELMKTAEKHYENSRGYLAGRMNKEDAGQDFYDVVDVVATSLVEPGLNKIDQLHFLEDNGFQITPFITAKGYELTEKMLSDYLKVRRTASISRGDTVYLNHEGHAIDGIVITLNDYALGQSLTRKSSSLCPMYAKKYKEGAEENQAITTVVKVHWKASKTSYLKPRVEVVPVRVGGVTITFATGFNAKYIIDNGIGPGAKIRLVRSGDVIPFITDVLESVEPSLPDESEYGETAWNETNVDLYVVNSENNEEIIINRLISVFTSLDAPNLKEGSIKALYEAGYTTAASIIKATERQLVSVIGQNGSKIYEGLKAKLNPIHLGKLAGASQIFGRGIGRRTMIKLVDTVALETTDDWLNLVPSTIVCIEGFEDITAQKIYDKIPAFIDFLKEIDGYYTLETSKTASSADLAGHVVVFTGVRDAALEAIIIDKGGTIGSSVSKKTTHLVCLDPASNSGKIQKAKDFGINVLTLETARTQWG